MVFLGTGLWLAVAETRAPAAVVPGEGAPPLRRQALCSLAVLAAVLTLAPRYGRLDLMVVGLLGLAAALFAATRGEATPPERHGPAWPYALVGLVAALNELTAFLLQRSPAADWRHPAFSDLMDPVFRWAPTRGALVLAWLAAGLWLLRVMPERAARSSESPEDLGPWEPAP